MVYDPLKFPLLCVDPPPSLLSVAPISKVASPVASVVMTAGSVNVDMVLKEAPPPLFNVVVDILTLSGVAGG